MFAERISVVLWYGLNVIPTLKVSPLSVDSDFWEGICMKPLHVSVEVVANIAEHHNRVPQC